MSHVAGSGTAEVVSILMKSMKPVPASSCVGWVAKLSRSSTKKYPMLFGPENVASDDRVGETKHG